MKLNKILTTLLLSTSILGISLSSNQTVHAIGGHASAGHASTGHTSSAHSSVSSHTSISSHSSISTRSSMSSSLSSSERSSASRVQISRPTRSSIASTPKYTRPYSSRITSSIGSISRLPKYSKIRYNSYSNSHSYNSLYKDNYFNHSLYEPSLFYLGLNNPYMYMYHSMYSNYPLNWWGQWIMYNSIVNNYHKNNSLNNRNIQNKIINNTNNYWLKINNVFTLPVNKVLFNKVNNNTKIRLINSDTIILKQYNNGNIYEQAFDVNGTPIGIIRNNILTVKHNNSFTSILVDNNIYKLISQKTKIKLLNSDTIKLNNITYDLNTGRPKINRNYYLNFNKNTIIPVSKNIFNKVNSKHDKLTLIDNNFLKINNHLINLNNE